ncbi:hypothetical protein EV356DRAFT_569217 [Viridothelium virens]|uniref:Putative zinc-finger domain-containing protein n=1 Tax=Viridothelium virens TaxID=1048519 RepID=A0A6A6H1Q0_VIRVR|nr:hypothetical protein EV356DRAFT_569217 [Viridothelium virens]
MSYYHPSQPPHGLQYGYPQGPQGQRPPFYTNGQQPPPQPNGAYYQNQTLPPVNPQAIGQNAPQYQQFLAHFQNGSLQPPYGAPPQSQYQYQYQQPQYQSTKMQQARSMQPQPPIALPPNYGYSEQAPVQIGGYSPSYGFPRMTSQSTPQEVPDLTRRDNEDRGFESENGVKHTQGQANFPENNAYRPDFSSIMQEPAEPSVVRQQEIGGDGKHPVESTETSHTPSGAVDESLQATAARITRTLDPVTHAQATAYSHHSNPPHGTAMDISHDSQKSASEAGASDRIFRESKLESSAWTDGKPVANPLDATSSQGFSPEDSHATSLDSKKQRAKAFVALLHDHDIGYPELARENVALDRLKAFYAELGISDLDQSTSNMAPKIPTEERIPTRTPPALKPPQVELTPSVINHQVEEANRPQKITAPGSDTHQPKTSPFPNGTIEATTSDEAIQKSFGPPPEIAKPVTAQAQPAPSISVNEKSTATTSRADYIARLKAARASKPSESEKSPAAATKDHFEKSKTTPTQPVPARSEGATITNLPDDAFEASETTNTTAKEEAAAAAQKKREAQTELARLRIEALNKSKPKAHQEVSPSTPAGIPGLTLVSTPQGTTSARQTAVTQSSESSLAPLASTARKRPVASDFDDAIPLPVAKKPFGQPRSEEMAEPIIIEASDDESDDENAGVALEDKATSTPTVVVPKTAETSKAAVRGVSRLPDFPPRPTASRQNTGLNSPDVAVSPIVQTPGTATPGSARPTVELDKYNAEIKMMKAKIELMEQRKKLQKAETSRPQSPLRNPQPKSDNLPPSSPAAVLNKIQSDPITGLAERHAEGLVTQMPSSSGLLSQSGPPLLVGVGEETQQNVVRDVPATHTDSLSIPSSPHASLQATNPTLAAQAELERKRRAEIQTKLFNSSAAIQAKKARLEQLRKEMEEIEEQTRRENEENADLAAELESLGVDTEGMPKEEMQAKRDEIIKRRELEIPVESDVQSTPAVDSQAPGQTLSKSSIAEDTEQVVGEMDEPAPDDRTKAMDLTPGGPLPLVAPSHTIDATRDAIRGGRENRKESPEEGELSDDGTRLSDDDHWDDPTSLHSAAPNQGVFMSELESIDSLSFNPHSQQSFPVDEDADVDSDREIISSPASTSTDTIMENPAAAEGVPVVAQPHVSDAVTTHVELRSDHGSIEDATENETLPVVSQDVGSFSEQNRPSEAELEACSKAPASVLEPTPPPSFLLPADEASEPVIERVGGESRREQMTAASSNLLGTEVNDHQVMDDAPASGPNSDDESDLYAVSNPVTPAARSGAPAAVGTSTTLADKDIGAPAIWKPAADVADDDDEDDDDDFYEPADVLPETAALPIRPSTSEPVYEPALPRAQSHSSESEDVEMDIDESSDADMASNIIAMDEPKIEGCADDLALELQPTGEDYQAIEQDVQLAPAEIDKYTAYESPLKAFKAYRFHPQYSTSIAGGFRSMTYSHRIDVNKELCPFEAIGGHCNDAHCQYQHFAKMGVTDDVVLLQMGTLNPGRNEEEKKEWTSGLRNVIKALREKGTSDAEIVAKEIADYRRDFLKGTTNTLNVII